MFNSPSPKKHDTPSSHVRERFLTLFFKETNFFTGVCCLLCWHQPHQQTKELVIARQFAPPLQRLILREACFYFVPADATAGQALQDISQQDTVGARIRSTSLGSFRSFFGGAHTKCQTRATWQQTMLLRLSPPRHPAHKANSEGRFQREEPLDGIQTTCISPPRTAVTIGVLPGDVWNPSYLRL